MNTEYTYESTNLWKFQISRNKLAVPSTGHTSHACGSFFVHALCVGQWWEWDLQCALNLKRERELNGKGTNTRSAKNWDGHRNLRENGYTTCLQFSPLYISAKFGNMIKSFVCLCKDFLWMQGFFFVFLMFIVKQPNCI